MLSTEDVCQSLYINPGWNPIEQKSITPYGSAYQNLMEQCSTQGSSTILSSDFSDIMTSDVANLDSDYNDINRSRIVTSTFNFEIPPEFKEYMDKQVEFGFTYRWNPNLYYQNEQKDEIVGIFEPNYTGPLSQRELMDMFRNHPEIAQAVIVKSDYHTYGFELKQFQHDNHYIKDKYELMQELGRGAFGVTYLAKDIIKNQPVAIKMIDITRLEGRGYNRQILNNEIETLSKLSDNGGSEYVVTYYESFEENYNGTPTMFIVSEYIQGVNLSTFIKMTEENGGFGPTVLWPLYFQLLLGLNYIHKSGYAHRDIKPDNIMITPNHTIKYIDFGLSCFQQCRIDACNNNCKGPHGTLAYIPPELLTKSLNVSSLSFNAYMSHDIWSIGLTMYQMANQGRLPRSEESIPNSRLKNILTVSFPIVSNYTLDRDNRTNDYLRSIIIKDPSLRSDIDGIIQLLIKMILQRVWSS